jgi:hypothetical protein
MSLIETYRFSAHPDIRIEIKIAATQPIERKRIDYSRTFAASRKFAEPRHFRTTQKKIALFHVVSGAGLPARVLAPIVKWRKPTVRPASK